MFEFLVHGWFWISVVTFILLVAFTAYDNVIGSLFVTAVAVASYQFFTDVGLFDWIGSNPGTFWLCVAGYVPVGLVWMFFKWYLKLSDVRSSLIEKKKNWFESNEEYLKKHSKDPEKAWKAKVESEKPKAKYHKSALINWMMYWPISMLWTLLDDFVTRIGKAVYNRVSGLLSKMSDKMFKNV